MTRTCPSPASTNSVEGMTDTFAASKSSLAYPDADDADVVVDPPTISTKAVEPPDGDVYRSSSGCLPQKSPNRRLFSLSSFRFSFTMIDRFLIAIDASTSDARDGARVV